jgi:hypothetical protein
MVEYISMKVMCNIVRGYENVFVFFLNFVMAIIHKEI